MSIILSIETASPICSVAIHEEDRLLATTSLFKQKSHSEKLAVIIDELLKHNNLEISSLDAVAVSEGPGSYTGLRIGVSSAKGICYGNDIPMIAINSLTALAQQMRAIADEGELLIPMFDARRMEVYAQVLDHQLNVLEATQPVILDMDSFNTHLSKSNALIFGDGAEKAYNCLKQKHVKYVKDIAPSAISVGALAFNKYLEKDFVDLAYFEPFYLKEYKAGKPKSLI